MIQKRTPRKIPYYRPVYNHRHCPDGKHNYYVMSCYYGPLKRLVKYARCLDCGVMLPYKILERMLAQGKPCRLSTAL